MQRNGSLSAAKHLEPLQVVAHACDNAGLVEAFRCDATVLNKTNEYVHFVRTVVARMSRQCLHC